MAQLNFDARTVAPAEAPEAIPAGWYNARVTNSEMKPTSDGSGAYLQLELTILDGEFANRKLFDRINLQNKNPVATEIGYRQLSAVCHATGVIQVQDSQQLHGIPLKVKVSLRPAGPGADGKHYDASNEVKGYKNIADGAGGAPAQAMLPQPQGFGQAPQQPAMPPQGHAPQQPQQYQQPAPQQWAPPVQQQVPQQPAQQWAPPPAAAPAVAQQAPAMQTAMPAQPAPAAQQGPAGNTPPWMQSQQQAPAQQAPQQPAPAAGPVPPWAQPQQ
jgi:hypothetical protein